MNNNLPKTGGNAALLYDLTYLESAGQEDREFIKKLVSMFIEIMPVNLDELNEVVKTKDFKQIRKTAHKIKSSIDLLGIHSLTDTIRAIEFIAEDDNTLEKHVETLNSMMIEVYAQLKELL